MWITRRTYLKYTSSLVGAGLGWNFATTWKDASASSPVQIEDITPINRSRHDHDLSITGDEPHQAHQILWSTTEGENQLPQPASSDLERVNVAIIGGGCSGLSAAWQLRDLKPVVLERASRMGGNAKGETWHGVPYSIGAAYMIKPSPNSEIDVFLKEIGATAGLKVSHHEPFFMMKDQKTRHSFKELLAQGTPEEQQAWTRLMKAFTEYSEEENGRFFPDLPTDQAQLRAQINLMDQESLSSLCKRLAGGSLSSAMQAYLEQYCWTAFGAGLSEVSAASGVNFLAGELDEHLIGPGGNSWITEQATRQLASSIGISHLRVNSLVYHVEVTDQGVVVRYSDHKQTRQILAKRVVLCCPKFVVKRILKGIEPSRLEAITQLKYRAYVVHQALLNTQLKNDFYELFLVGKDSANEHLSRRDRSLLTGVTDLTYGNFAEISDQYTILSLYQAFPFDSGRAELYQNMDLSSHREHIQKRLQTEILPALQVPANALQGLRSARWGHPLPVASPRLIHSGVVDQLRAPHQGKVFFAQQDNWALPAIETALYEGMKAARDVRASL